MDRLIESLEGRRMMSNTPVDVTLAAVQNPDGSQKNVLTINNAVDVKVQQFGPKEVVVTSGTQSAVYTGAADDHGDFLDVDQIVIRGTNGGDSIILMDKDIQALIYTNSGPDVLSLYGSAQTSVFTTNPADALVVIDPGSGRDMIEVSNMVLYVYSSKGPDIVSVDDSLGPI